MKRIVLVILAVAFASPMPCVFAGRLSSLRKKAAAAVEQKDWDRAIALYEEAVQLRNRKKDREALEDTRVRAARAHSHQARVYMEQNGIAVPEDVRTWEQLRTIQALVDKGLDYSTRPGGLHKKKEFCEKARNILLARIRDAVAAARTAMSNADWLEARRHLDRARAIRPDAPEVVELEASFREAAHAAHREAMLAAEAEGDLDGALAAAAELAETIPGDDSWKGFYATLTKTFDALEAGQPGDAWELVAELEPPEGESPILEALRSRAAADYGQALYEHAHQVAQADHAGMLRDLAAAASLGHEDASREIAAYRRKEVARLRRELPVLFREGSVGNACYRILSYEQVFEDEETFAGDRRRCLDALAMRWPRSISILAHATRAGREDDRVLHNILLSLLRSGLTDLQVTEQGTSPLRLEVTIDVPPFEEHESSRTTSVSYVADYREVENPEWAAWQQKWQLYQQQHPDAGDKERIIFSAVFGPEPDQYIQEPVYRDYSYTIHTKRISGRLVGNLHLVYDGPGKRRLVLKEAAATTHTVAEDEWHEGFDPAELEEDPLELPSETDLFTDLVGQFLEENCPDGSAIMDLLFSRIRESVTQLLATGDVKGAIELGMIAAAAGDDPVEGWLWLEELVSR